MISYYKIVVTIDVIAVVVVVVVVVVVDDDDDDDDDELVGVFIPVVVLFVFVQWEGICCVYLNTIVRLLYLFYVANVLLKY